MRYAGKTYGELRDKCAKLESERFTGVLRVQFENGKIKFITIGDRFLGIETPIQEDR